MDFVSVLPCVHLLLVTGYYVVGAWQAEDVGSSFSHGKAYAFINVELFPSA